MAKVAVLGAGAWGAALAHHLSASSGGAAGCTGSHHVSLWGRQRVALVELRGLRKPSSLPGVVLSDALEIEPDIEAAVAGAELVVFAVPCHALRPVSLQAASALPPDATLVIACKGIEKPELLLPAQVLAQTLGASAADRTVIFSGPSFAKEVAREQPTSVVAAAPNPERARAVQAAFSRRNMRVYTSQDPTGVQVAGALKNVIAVAVGASDGLGLGPNARAALITRGLSEMARLAVAMGGNAATVSGLAGLGDLVLTCTDAQSRNRTVGFELGRGRSVQEVLAGLTEVAEGVSTAESAVGLSRQLGVDLPISHEVYRVLYQGRTPQSAVETLMSRSLKPE